MNAQRTSSNQWSNHQVSIWSVYLMFLAISSVNSETIFVQKFPVNRVLSTQVQTRLNRLKDYLSKDPSQADKQELYLRAKLCEVYLQELARQSMRDYSNLMDGQKNHVDGANNIVIGAKNKITGKNNWVFSTNYDQSADRVLVIDKWKIQLDKIEAIRMNPNIAISKW